MDRVVEEATRLVVSCPFDAPHADLEAAMDYLTFREDFMALLDLRAESLLGRRFAGPEDAPFEEIMVDTLTLLEQRLADVIPSSTRHFAPNLGDN